MNCSQAFSILGFSAHGVPFRNMITALQLLPRLNTPEDNARLEAALWVQRHRKAYDDYCHAERDRRFSSVKRPRS